MTMNKTTELYPKLVNAAEMEWREFRQSGASDEEVAQAFDFWMNLMALTRRVEGHEESSFSID